MAVNQVVVALDILAFAAAIAMTFQAARAHRAIGSRTSMAFLTCFSLVSLGLFFRMITDVLFEIGFSARLLVELYTTHVSTNLFLLISALCILSAYTLLLLVVEQVRQRSMWVLVFILVIFTVLLARNIYLFSHAMAIVLLALLAHHFWKNFLRKNTTGSLLVYLAFFSLMAAHVSALFAPLHLAPHIIFLALRLLGFFLLFAMSWRLT